MFHLRLSLAFLALNFPGLFIAYENVNWRLCCRKSDYEQDETGDDNGANHNATFLLLNCLRAGNCLTLQGLSPSLESMRRLPKCTAHTQDSVQGSQGEPFTLRAVSVAAVI